MAYEIAGITTCNLCQRKFAGPLALIIGPGQHPQGRLVNHLNQLAQHFCEAHPEENNALQLKALEYLGMLRLLNYSTSDEELRRQLDFLRWSIHQSTLLHRVPDEKIAAKAEEHARGIVDIFESVLPPSNGPGTDQVREQLRPALQAAIAAKLAAVLSEVRNILEEPGRYLISPIEAANATENTVKQ